ncbi:MAG TPA: hypothetical protein VMB26_03755 [Candidatus Binataceae bacterium]|nr:hypothetical protein [Candidatus Binataceae bacterium]
MSAAALAVSMLVLEGCFYGGPGGYYPGPAYGPAYGYAEPRAPLVVYGDYDEHHAWHDRDWWVNSRPQWVHEHHPEWIASREHPEHVVR